MILEKINKPNDIKTLRSEEYEILAMEIRDFLIGKFVQRHKFADNERYRSG